MLNLVKNLWSDQKGQAMAEYGLILALVAVVVYAAVKLLGENISSRLEDVAGKIGPETASGE